MGEDVEANQFLIQKIFLEDKRFSLNLAKNGERVLQLLGKFEYDLILMDLTMPILDGTDTTRIIRNSPVINIRGIPIIAPTARLNDEDYEDSMEAVRDAFLGKPIDPDEFFLTIEKVLKKKSKKRTPSRPKTKKAA